MKYVQTIKDANKLQEIQAGLEADESRRGRRMFLMFMTGIYTGLRISDIVKLKAGNVRGDSIILREQKTGKASVIPVAVILQRVIADRTADMSDDDFLFVSRARGKDGKPKHITTRTAYDDMNEIARRFGLRGSIGCHTMRKTFGYWHYQKNHDLEILRQWFNHSTVNVTRRYIGVDVEERRRSVQGFSLGYEPTTRARPMKAAAVPVEIVRQDKTENGRKYGQAAQIKRKKKSSTL